MSRRILVLRSIALVALARLLLRRRGTTATMKVLAGRGRRHGQIDPGQALGAVRRAGSVVGGACLQQSVALAALLQRGGRSPTLVLGCLNDDVEGWTAHAWVELDGTMLEPVRGKAHQTLAHLDASTGWVPSRPSSGG